MNPGIILLVAHDAAAFLVVKGLLTQNGSLGKFTLSEYTELGGAVVKSLKSHGVTIRAEIDMVLSILPLVFSIIGSRELSDGNVAPTLTLKDFE